MAINKTINTGDIIAFNTKAIWYNPLTWLGYIIRIIAKIKYNHVGIVILKNGTKYIYEAVNKGFLKKELNEKLTDYKHIKKYIILRPNYKFDKEKLIKEATALLGNKYDFKGLLWNQLILNLTGIWIGRKENQQNKLYCYEAVFYLHRKVFPKWWKEKPQDLFINKKFKIITND